MITEYPLQQPWAEHSREKDSDCLSPKTGYMQLSSYGIIFVDESIKFDIWLDVSTFQHVERQQNVIDAH